MSTDSSSSSSSSSCGDEISVTITPYFQKEYDLGTHKGFRLRIEVNSACGIDEEIFRYYQKPLNLQGELESVFSGVCSWPDLEELPVSEPESDTNPAGFRLSYIDIVVDSESIATAVWELIQTQVTELVQTVKAGQELEATDSVTISSS